MFKSLITRYLAFYSLGHEHKAMLKKKKNKKKKEQDLKRAGKEWFERWYKKEIQTT